MLLLGINYYVGGQYSEAVIYSASFSKCFHIKNFFHLLLSPGRFFRTVIFSCNPFVLLFISHFQKGIKILNK